METCETLKDVGQGGRRRWAVMSHSKAAAASPGTGAGGAVVGGGEARGQGRFVPNWCPCASAETSPEM